MSSRLANVTVIPDHRGGVGVRTDRPSSPLPFHPPAGPRLTRQMVWCHTMQARSGAGGRGTASAEPGVQLSREGSGPGPIGKRTRPHSDSEALCKWWGAVGWPPLL
ncbi:hypothetical protein NDU88_003476 [Pleurodeles waltl]|uniref:Uncharacterized protein n=1 Tax=Pleurodeles waltl TaxID=8319 RepID=A0AAV7UCK7_PLEWA|nr:hypothetical protein NDU88_003476 [Pleurodeles waltl]